MTAKTPSTLEIYLAERLVGKDWLPLFNPFMEGGIYWYGSNSRRSTPRLTKDWAQKLVGDMNEQHPDQEHRIARYVRAEAKTKKRGGR